MPAGLTGVQINSNGRHAVLRDDQGAAEDVA